MTSWGKVAAGMALGAVKGYSQGLLNEGVAKRMEAQRRWQYQAQAAMAQQQHANSMALARQSQGFDMARLQTQQGHDLNMFGAENKAQMVRDKTRHANAVQLAEQGNRFTTEREATQHANAVQLAEQGNQFAADRDATQHARAMERTDQANRFTAGQDATQRAHELQLDARQRVAQTRGLSPQMYQALSDHAERFATETDEFGGAIFDQQKYQDEFNRQVMLNGGRTGLLPAVPPAPGTRQAGTGEPEVPDAQRDAGSAPQEPETTAPPNATHREKHAVTQFVRSLVPGADVRRTRSGTWVYRPKGGGPTDWYELTPDDVAKAMAQAGASEGGGNARSPMRKPQGLLTRPDGGVRQLGNPKAMQQERGRSYENYSGR